MKTTALVTLLQETTEVSSLLTVSVQGPAPRPAAIYKQVLPRGFNLPAIVVHRYNGTRDQDLGGPVDAREDNFQLDIYGDTQDDCDAATDACRELLVGFTGTLDDGTVIQGCYLDQDRDMPFLPNADTKGLAFRALLGLRFISTV